MKDLIVIKKDISIVDNFLSSNANPFIIGRGNQNPTDIRSTMFRQALARTRQDVASWRACLTEAESQILPHRVKMQTLFVDTILNGHVKACMDGRKRLTLSKKYGLYNKAGELLDIDLFKGRWIRDFISYTIDAKFYGYSLIRIGDIIAGKVTKSNIVRRANVSPDRLNVASYLNGIGGASFMEGEFVDWTVYVDTPSETGASDCGYGLLYNVALYEIFLRNLLAYNGDFVELFAQPFRHGKTNKTEEDERAAFEQAVANSGSSGWIVTDDDDTISFIETALGGTGYNGYDNLEKRCEQKISKILLGHADALDSIPGKLGGGTGEDNPATRALEMIENEDITDVEAVFNELLIPKLKRLGIKVPDGVFKFENNKEAEDTRRKVDESNKNTAEIAKEMKQGGLAMEPQYFTERTGIPCTVIVAPTPVATPESQQLTEDIKNKLTSLYKVK